LIKKYKLLLQILIFISNMLLFLHNEDEIIVKHKKLVTV